jgi:hypothetical protein
VSGGFLETIGGRLLHGRSITAEDDRPGAAPVVVLTERMATTIWPGESALGKCLIVANGPCSAVVGVIADVHREALDEEAFMLYFVPFSQGEIDSPQFLLVRTAGKPDAYIDPVRRAVQSLRSDLPFVSVREYGEEIDNQAQSWRMGSAMFVLFGGLSLVIAAVGLYGVLSYSVTQRTPELGIRAAVGATPADLRRMVILSGLLSAAAGVAIGAVVAILLGGEIQGLLFQTSARNPVVFALAAGLVLSIALAASAIPGRRATQVDPLRALRAE